MSYRIHDRNATTLLMRSLSVTVGQALRLPRVLVDDVILSGSLLGGAGVGFDFYAEASQNLGKTRKL